MHKISVVVPIYCEGKNIMLVYERLSDILDQTSMHKNIDWELILVDDGSNDDSWKYIKDLYLNHPDRVKAIKFSRNFGKEVALIAGVEHSRDSDAIICMDADLQHPPELIPEFIRKWKEGAQVVVGIRKKVADYGLIKKVGSKLFYKIMNYFSEIKIEPQSTDFRLMDKKVVEAFCQFSEQSSMFRGLVDWLGFERDYIEFEAPERAGESRPTYSLKKLVRLAINSIVSFSWLPLRITGYTGAVVISVSLLLLLIMIVTHILHFTAYTIMAYFIVMILFLVGVVLSAIGFLALYIEQIHRQVQNRPLYIISNIIQQDKHLNND